MSGIAKGQVSILCAEIDERVRTFLNWPMAGDWPYLQSEAISSRVRVAGRNAPVAAILAVGANTDSRRKLLGGRADVSVVEPLGTD